MSDLEPSVSFKPERNQIEIKDTVIELNSYNVEKNLEASEGRDKLEPLKTNYENKAFELEDVEIDSNEKNNNNKNNFDRQRPGSMMSIKSSASTSSRSSINCNSGRIKCPNIRMKRFYSYKENEGFIKACEDIKKLILPEKDGNFIGNWLLIEISVWDLHREKVILLTEKTLFIISYDFIRKRIHDYKRIKLSDIKRVNFGNLKYPQSSIMGEYLYGAVKIGWGNENLSFSEKWNPFNSNIPLIMLTSHHILYNEKEKETELYNCDEFISSLEFVLSKLPENSNIEFKEESIEIKSYASLFSILYNQNWLGFQLDRNGISF